MGGSRGRDGDGDVGAVAAAFSHILGDAILQLNRNDVQSSRTDQAEYLSKKGIKVACLQKSNLS